MRVYIFKDVVALTNNYHCEGGLVVVAKDEKHVDEMVQKANDYDDWDDFALQAADIHLTEGDWKNVITYPTSDNAEPNIFVFPNAGCC